MLTTSRLHLFAAALLLSVAAAGAQAQAPSSPANSAKPGAYGDTCEALPGYDGLVVQPANSAKDSQARCKPGTGLTIYALPPVTASYIVAALCDVTKPVSILPFDDGRVTAFCTYRGAEGLPDKVSGTPILMGRP